MTDNVLPNIKKTHQYRIIQCFLHYYGALIITIQLIFSRHFV